MGQKCTIAVHAQTKCFNFQFWWLEALKQNGAADDD